MVSQHLKAAGHDIKITPSDYLCFACYKLHCSIIETIKAEGYDDMLQQDIKKWENKYIGMNMLLHFHAISLADVMISV